MRVSLGSSGSGGPISSSSSGPAASSNTSSPCHVWRKGKGGGLLPRGGVRVRVLAQLSVCVHIKPKDCCF